MTTLQEVQEKLLKAELAYAEKYIELASGLRQDDINTMSQLEKKSSSGTGAYGIAETIVYKGKPYLRKSTTFSKPDDFLSEVMIMKLLTGNAVTRPFVPFFYGAAMSVDQYYMSEGYILMEKLVGKTLGEILTRRGLTTEELKNLQQQLRNILDVFHDEGYVHGDLHAGNVFILMDGNKIIRPILIDFGRSIRREHATEFNISGNQGLYKTPYNNNLRFDELFKLPRWQGSETWNFIRNTPKNISKTVNGPMKARNMNGFTLSSEAQEELKPFALEVVKSKEALHTLLETMGESRKQKWVETAQQYNNTKKYQRQKDVNQSLLWAMGKLLDEADLPPEVKKIVIDLQDDILKYVAEMFDIMRFNGLRYFFSQNKSIELGHNIMKAFVRAFVRVYTETKSIEQGLVEAQKDYDAEKQKGADEIAVLRTPTSFYGGRRSTRKRRNRGTRRKRNVQSS